MTLMTSQLCTFPCKRFVYDFLSKNKKNFNFWKDVFFPQKKTNTQEKTDTCTYDQTGWVCVSLLFLPQYSHAETKNTKKPKETTSNKLFWNVQTIQNNLIKLTWHGSISLRRYLKRDLNRNVTRKPFKKRKKIQNVRKTCDIIPRWPRWRSNLDQLICVNKPSWR